LPLRENNALAIANQRARYIVRLSNYVPLNSVDPTTNLKNHFKDLEDTSQEENYSEGIVSKEVFSKFKARILAKA